MPIELEGELVKIMSYSTFNVPSETKEKIRKFKKENGLPSMSQAVTVMAERYVTKSRCFDFLLTLSKDVSERIDKPLKEVTLDEVFKVLREISEEKKK